MNDAIERSDALDKRIASSDAIDHLTRASRRNLLLIRLLAVSIAFDLFLSMGLGIVAFRANQTAEQANSLQARARTTCLSGNETRAGQIQLWHYILDLPPSTPRTEAQQQQVEQFRAYLDHLFVARKC